MFHIRSFALLPTKKVFDCFFFFFNFLVHHRRANSDAEEPGQGGDAVRQQPGPEGQVALRRIHVEIQLDLTLLIKLAFIVALFGQDGSRQRKMFLILLATIVYL